MVACTLAPAGAAARRMQAMCGREHAHAARARALRTDYVGHARRAISALGHGRPIRAMFASRPSGAIHCRFVLASTRSASVDAAADVARGAAAKAARAAVAAEAAHDAAAARAGHCQS
jgi:hypothetical protein